MLSRICGLGPWKTSRTLRLSFPAEWVFVGPAQRCSRNRYIVGRPCRTQIVQQGLASSVKYLTTGHPRLPYATSTQTGKARRTSARKNSLRLYGKLGVRSIHPFAVPYRRLRNAQTRSSLSLGSSMHDSEEPPPVGLSSEGPSFYHWPPPSAAICWHPRMMSSLSSGGSQGPAGMEPSVKLTATWLS